MLGLELMGKDSGGNGGVIVNMSSLAGMYVLVKSCSHPQYKFLLRKNLSSSSLKKIHNYIQTVLHLFKCG